MRRFSIAGLMAAVLVCGVAVAALRDASDTWAGVLLGLTLLMLGTALLGILHRRGARRAFWQGFALFGWGYLALTTGPWASEQVGPRLPTSHLLGYAFSRLNPDPEPYIARYYADLMVVEGASASNPGTGATRLPAAGQLVASGGGRPAPLAKADVEVAIGKGLAFFASAGNRDQFVRVGHSLIALLSALVGGLIARWFQRTDGEIAA